MTTNPETHTCPDCGYTWQHGQHGGHSCATHLKAQLEQLKIAGEQMVFSLCFVAPALLSLHGPRHDLRALIDSARCGLEHAIAADPTWRETAASEGVTLSNGNVWMARPSNPPVELNNIPASPDWSALQSLAKVVADANEYCQQIGLGKWGESATATLIADHKRLSETRTSVEGCNAAVAAIQFALEDAEESALDFLRCWNEGEFDAIRKEWPEAPEAVFIGADPLHPDTEWHDEREGQSAELAAAIQAREEAISQVHGLQTQLRDLVAAAQPIISALAGPSHHIREMQATVKIDENNPIIVLAKLCAAYCKGEVRP